MNEVASKLKQKVKISLLRRRLVLIGTLDLAPSEIAPTLTPDTQHLKKSQNFKKSTGNFAATPTRYLGIRTIADQLQIHQVFYFSDD